MMMIMIIIMMMMMMMIMIIIMMMMMIMKVTKCVKIPEEICRDVTVPHCKSVPARVPVLRIAKVCQYLFMFILI